MSQLLATLHGVAPKLSGVATIWRVEEYRDKPKPTEKKVYVKPEHNMIMVERENRARVLAIIKKKPSNTTEIIAKTNLSRSAVHGLTKTLVEDGDVRQNRDIWPWIYEVIRK